MVKQIVNGLAIVALSCGQAQPDREALPVDDRVDFGREPASGATEIMISIPFLPSRPAGGRERMCCRSSGCLAVGDGGDGIYHPIPYTCLSSSHQAVVAGGARTVTLGQITPWRAGAQDPEDVVQHAPVIYARYTSGFVGKQRFDHTPFEVGQIISAYAKLASPGSVEWKHILLGGNRVSTFFAMLLRHCLVFAAATALTGCNRGGSACERATKAALPAQSEYQQITAKEEPGETPAMTYWVIDYFVTAPGGSRRRELVHCAYMRDTGEAEPHRITSIPAPL